MLKFSYGKNTPYEKFKTLTTNDLQFHSPIRFNQSGPGMPVSKITFHAHPYQTGLQPVLQWKVQTFPRTVHTAPHHTTFCGLQPWKVIFVSHFPVFLISHIRNQIALPRTFCSTSDTSGRKTPSQTLFKSLCVTSGNCRPASQPSPGHIPIFPMCYIRSEYGLAHGFSSRSVTSGTNTPLHAVIPPYHIGIPPPCSTLPSMAHPRFPDVSHREQKRPLTHFSFPICHIGEG